MAERKSLIELKAFRRRGDIYRWLREHHEDVLRDIEELQRPWAVICAEMASSGVRGARGGPPYATSVRKTWARVCRDVEAERERREARKAQREARDMAVAAEGRGGYSSRPPRDLRPRQVVSSVPAVRGPCPPPTTASQEFRPWEDESLTPEQAAHIKEQFEKMARRNQWMSRSDRHVSPEEYHVLAMEFDLDYRAKYLEQQKVKEGK